MYGKGIIKGLGVTLKRFVNTYIDDIAWWGHRYYTPEGIAHRQHDVAHGVSPTVKHLPSNIIDVVGR